MKIPNPARHRKSNSSKQLLDKQTRKISKERKVKQPLTEKYIKQLINAAEGREERIIRIMLETGMHPAVMSDPAVHEMEIDKDRLVWRRPKTFAFCVWEFEKEGFNSGVIDVFLENDLGFRRETYYSDVKKAAARAGLKYISPLTLRHTGVVVRFERGETPEQVQAIWRMSTEVLWGNYAKFMGIEVRRQTGD